MLDSRDVGKIAYSCGMPFALLEISGTTLDSWSDQETSDAKLPVLVRRLVGAGAPADAVIRFRADGGTRLPGYDGETYLPSSSFPAPAGAAVWELSTQNRAGPKAEEDYRKRTAEPGDVQLATTTYVAVTSRHWPKKHEWEAQKRVEGIWANVLALDADDLSLWLERSPAVAAWFAREELRRPVSEVDDVDNLLKIWQFRTAPPLPLDALLVSRTQEVQSVRDWVHHSPGLLRVQGETREEALYFTAAALARDEGTDWRTCTLVVRSETALAWALQEDAGRPLIVLPALEDSIPVSGEFRHHLLLPYGRGEHPQEPFINLLPVNRHQLEEVLADVLPPGEPRRLAHQSGGSMGALQRLLGHDAQPLWAQGFLTPELQAMLFAGSWEPSFVGDQEAVRHLAGGREWADVDRACAGLESSTGAHIRRREESWAWRSVPDVWRLLVEKVPSSQLDVLDKVVLDVLREDDPAAGLPPDERLALAFQGKTRRHSDALRRGLATTLALIANAEWGPRALGGAARRRACVASIVRRLLDDGWQRWASLHKVLPILAEAAPEAFLDALLSSLKKGKDGVLSLFVMEQGFWGSNPHTDLLWALEVLGWAPERMPRVAHALGQLANADPGGQTANRPAAVLKAMLRNLWPQTLATREARVQSLKSLEATAPRVAWKLALDLLPDRSDSGPLDAAMRPSFLRPPAPERPDKVFWDVAFAEGVLETTLKWVGSDCGRWAELLRHLEGCQLFVVSRSLDLLAARVLDVREKDRKSEVWAAARHLLHNLLLLRHLDARVRIEVPSALLMRARELYEALAPTDGVRRVAWVFTHDVVLPEDLGFDWQAAEQRKQQVRIEVLRPLISGTELVENLHRLVDEVAQPELLGESLAGLQVGAVLDERLFACPFDKGPRRRALLMGYVHARTPQEDASWLLKVLQSLVELGQLEDAAYVALRLPHEGFVWDLLEVVSTALADTYWKLGPRIFIDTAPADIERAIIQLLRVNRPLPALEAVSLPTRNGEAPVSAQLALEVLEACVLNPDDLQKAAGGLTMVGFHVGRALKCVGDGADIATERVMAVELFFLPLLQHTGRTPRLHAELASSPMLWAELVSRAYLSHGEEQGAGDSEELNGGEGARAPESEANESRTPARIASRILLDWDGWPGEDAIEGKRDENVATWIEAALVQLEARGVTHVGLPELARVLARVPATDGLWPCLAVRRLLEEDRIPNLRRHLVTAKINSRGLVRRSFGEGGDQERALAQRFRERSHQLGAEFPITSAMLVDLAENYERHAEQEDQRAEAMRDP